MVQFTNTNLSLRSSRWNTDAARFSIAAENRCRSRPHADICLRSSHRFSNQRSTNSSRMQTNFHEVSVSNVMLPGWSRDPATVEFCWNITSVSMSTIPVVGSTIWKLLVAIKYFDLCCSNASWASSDLCLILPSAVKHRSWHL